MIIIIKKSIKFNIYNISSNNINFFNSSFNINDKFFFNISSVKYYFSYKFNKVELNYLFLCFDKENKIIIPSDLSLYYDLHAYCVLKIGNNELKSMSNIHLNKYFDCLEYYELNQSISFGIKICKGESKCFSFDIFDNNYFDYNDIKTLNDDKFNFNYINNHYLTLSKNVRTKNSLYLLKNSYISQPITSTKEKSISKKNVWFFKNIYNHYFCFCKGHDCKVDNSFDICKYYLYLNIIDKNKYLYEKTDYLLADFITSSIAPGDAYFLFQEMIKQNLSAFYLTGRNDIYQLYFDNSTKFQKIIPMIKKSISITGNFLENYLTLILRLKSVISGARFFSRENIFFNIPYITFICLGHGVNYFKSYLYNDYYGCKRYNKIILVSEEIISIAKQYGWKMNNIIKVGLPKWDLFDKYSLEMQNKLKEKCMFTMFTWRKFKIKNKNKKISPSYFNNIFKLLNNPELIQILYKSNITMYLSLHHNLLNKRKLIKTANNIKYIKQDDILTCLMKCDLVVSDFSSVIFDLMYRNKPFIIYIPDADDKKIDKFYSSEYIDIINSLKNGSTQFENIFFNIKDVIKKIAYYISNNFLLDSKLEKLYNKFDLNHKNNTIRLIQYLKALK